MPADSRVQLGSNPNRLGKRLDSWKQIAGYLDRHVTTVGRWENQENLPIHRHLHSKLDSVYAYSMELDAWIERPSPGRIRHYSDEGTIRSTGSFRVSSAPTIVEGSTALARWSFGARTRNRAA